MFLRANYRSLQLVFLICFGLNSLLLADRPYNPFVITVTDQQTGEPVPLVELKTVNKISFLTDSNGQIAFFEPGLMSGNDVYFFVTAPHGYNQLDDDYFGNKGKTFQPTTNGKVSFTLTKDDSVTDEPEYSALESFRLEHNYNVKSGTYAPYEIEVVDSATDRGVPLVEMLTNTGLRFVTDSAGRISFYEPDLMNCSVNFTIRTYGYSYSDDDTVTLITTSGGYGKLTLQRNNLAERLYRITGGGIYRDSALLGKSTPLKYPVLNAKVFGQDTVDMCAYKNSLFWLWGDTDRPAYPLGNFKTTCAYSVPLANGGLDQSVGIDLNYFQNSDGFVKSMLPIDGASLVWMNTLVTVDDNGTQRLMASYCAMDGTATAYEYGFAIFNDSTKLFEPYVQIGSGHNITPTSQAHKRDGYVYINSPYPTIRIKADLATFGDPSLYEAFTCLMPGTGFADGSTQIERDADNKLVWGWKANTSPLSDSNWNTLVNNGLVQNNEAWNRLYDVDSGDHVMAAGASAAYNPYRNCWVMVVQQMFGTSFLGETWVSAAKSPEGPWTKAKKIVTHTRPDMAYTFYNVAYHPEFNQENGKLIYFEGTYTNTYTGNDDPTPLYNYNQMMYRLDLSDERLDDIWPEDSCVSNSYMQALDFAGEDTVIDDIDTFVPEPDCKVDIYDMLAFSIAWLSSGSDSESSQSIEYAEAFDVAGAGTVVSETDFTPQPDSIVNIYDFAVLSYCWLSFGLQ